MSLRGNTAVLCLAWALVTACGQRSDEPEDRGRVNQVERAALRAERPWEPGVVLVKPLRAGPAAGGGRALAASLQLDHLSGPGKTGVHRMRIRGEQDARQAAARLTRHPQLAYAEPNYRIELAAVPDDPSFCDCWALHNTGQFGGTPDADIDAPEAWDISTGSREVIVALIDTGIDLEHPDLIDNIWTNPDEIPDNGLDDDGNGYIDDVHGWSFVDDSNDVQDSHGHGTACAGAIGAVGDNGLGVAGVAWNVQIMPIRFRTYGNDPDYEETYTLDAAEAIYYAVDEGARVTSNSWTSWFPSQTLYDAVSYADEHEVLVIGAAGNQASNIEYPGFNKFPAEWEHDCVISVAATDDADRPTWWSNWGPEAADLAAPGENVLTTALGGSYESFGGTSLSTPLVAGTAALLLAIDPEASLQDVRHCMLSTVDPLPGVSGWTATDGRLNAHRAVQAMSGQPLPPRAHAGADRVVVTREPVQLDGSASVDPNRDAISYHWTLTPPAGSAAVLDDATAVDPSFLADRCGTYTAELTVTDAGGLVSAPHRVRIAAMNRAVLDPPIATPDPYPNNWMERWTISHPGASSMGVRFSDFITEEGRDWVAVLDGQGQQITQLCGIIGRKDVTGAAGEELTIRMTTNGSNVRKGFSISTYWWCGDPSCSAGTGDCNGEPADGCETDVTGDVDHCGWCGHPCTFQNASAACTDGRCEMGACDEGFFDCDDDPSNGCESDPMVDPANCGGCGQPCEPAPHAHAACVAGECQMGECEPQHADCNADPADGCEIHTGLDADNCGACGHACSLPNAEHSYCDMDECRIGDCQHRLEDIETEHPYPNYTQQEWRIEHPGANTIQIHFAAFHLEDRYDHLRIYDADDDLVESYTGDLGAFVSAEVPGDTVRLVLDSDPGINFFGFAVDWSRACFGSGCAAGYGDCNADPADGCEVDTTGDIEHCGGCDQVCAYTNAEASCNDGSCAMDDCLAGFGDCNAGAVDGCEADLMTDMSHCGACGQVCDTSHASGSCQDGVCVLSDCDAGWADCNADTTDGCETNTDSNEANCGGCGETCQDGSRCVDGVCTCPDADGDGDAAAVCGGGDCDDADPAVHSAAAEDCDNAIDDNCDGRTNEGCQMPDDGGDGGCGCGPTRPGHPAAGLLAGLALLLALLWRRTGQRAKGCCPIVKDSRGA